MAFLLNPKHFCNPQGSEYPPLSPLLRGNLLRLTHMRRLSGKQVSSLLTLVTCNFSRYSINNYPDCFRDVFCASRRHSGRHFGSLLTLVTCNLSRYGHKIFN